MKDKAASEDGLVAKENARAIFFFNFFIESQNDLGWSVP